MPVMFLQSSSVRKRPSASFTIASTSSKRTQWSLATRATTYGHSVRSPFHVDLFRAASRISDLILSRNVSRGMLMIVVPTSISSSCPGNRFQS